MQHLEELEIGAHIGILVIKAVRLLNEWGWHFKSQSMFQVGATSIW